MSFGFRGWRGGRRRGAKGFARQGGARGGPPLQCICPACGMVVQKVAGQPCFMTPCPRCKARMVGRFAPDESQTE